MHIPPTPEISYTHHPHTCVTPPTCRCFIEDACTDMMHISGVARRLTQHPGRYRWGGTVGAGRPANAVCFYDPAVLVILQL